MSLNVEKIFQACNPSKMLMVEHESDRQYYSDLSSVRGGDVVKQFRRTITLSLHRPTCQFFTGYGGCGKTTELMRLRAELQQQGIHVVYICMSDIADLEDIQITDLLLIIANQVMQSLESLQISIQPTYLKSLLEEISALPNYPQSSGNSSFAQQLGQLLTFMKDDPKLRQQLRQHLEKQVKNIWRSLNEELLPYAIEQLKQQAKKGLVIIIDDLDRLGYQNILGQSPTGCVPPQAEQLFRHYGDQLLLNCHVIYTVPLSLILSPETTLKSSFKEALALLPLVPVKLQSGEEFAQGVNLLKQVVLARAFPQSPPETRLGMIPQLFDDPNTLEQLCAFSGGHLRYLLRLLWGCLQITDPPISPQILAQAIAGERKNLMATITEEEWQLLQTIPLLMHLATDRFDLLKRMLVFPYHHERESWLLLNPLLSQSTL